MKTQPSRTEKAPPRERRRTYRQYCSIARALEVVGERWTFLLVRELLTGPRRFKDLLTALPSMGANLLAERLRQLQADGVIRHTILPPPASVAVYELTERGRGLESVLLALSHWGLPLLGPRRRGEQLSPQWAVMGFKSAFQADAARGVHEAYQLHVGQDVYRLRVDDGTLAVAHGAADNPALVIRTDAQTLLAVAAGDASVAAALSKGSIAVEGAADAAARCLAIFGFQTS